MGIILIAFGACYERWAIPQIVLVLIFVALFEFSSGPIVWIYMSEVMTDKGTSFGTLVNLILTITFAIITPFVISAALFYIVGAITLIVIFYDLILLFREGYFVSS